LSERYSWVSDPTAGPRREARDFSCFLAQGSFPEEEGEKGGEREEKQKQRSGLKIKNKSKKENVLL
jgi:hypothetical protein